MYQNSTHRRIILSKKEGRGSVECMFCKHRDMKHLMSMRLAYRQPAYHTHTHTNEIWNGAPKPNMYRLTHTLTPNMRTAHILTFIFGPLPSADPLAILSDR